MRFIQVGAIFVSIICVTTCARILGIFHMPSYSHFQLGDRIFKELAARGHEVTVITPFELKEPVKNLKHVVLTGFAEQLEDDKHNLFKQPYMSIISTLMWINTLGYHLTERVLNHTNVQALLKSNETFDIVFHENFFNEAFTGFAAYYKAPNVLLNSHGASSWTNSKMGNPHNSGYIPEIFLCYSRDMNFLQRILNSFVYLTSEILNHLYSFPNHQQLLQKYFPGSPPLTDLIYNTSLMLLNSHVSMGNPLPLVPNMIEIGGYHVQPPKPLPTDLQDYLDGAKDGVVFFSMGSILQSTDIPKEKRNAILKVLGKLKQKVLWKWEDDILPDQPINVKLTKWLPQQDILAHPSTKLFITHGGILSTIEAIYHGVPLLGLPVYGDQKLNVASAENAGYGIGLPFNNVNEETLSTALNQILKNPKYAENAKQKSILMQDQLTKPLDRAVYWIEYVLRHRGAPHLRTAALNLQWYQYLLLDVIVMLAFITLSILWILYKMVKVICRKKTKTSMAKHKKRN